MNHLFSKQHMSILREMEKFSAAAKASHIVENISLIVGIFKKIFFKLFFPTPINRANNEESLIPKIILQGINVIAAINTEVKKKKPSFQNDTCQKYKFLSNYSIYLNFPNFTKSLSVFESLQKTHLLAS